MAMRLALDTNRYIDFARGLPEARHVLESADAIHLPLMVLVELRAGFAVGTQGSKNEGALRRLLLRSDVGVVLPDEQTTHHYASVYRQLRHQGTPIPTNDLWIAALVLQHDLVLYSRDPHFDHLPQIPRV
jgi:predicted nucleic acid-binding protein